MPQFDISTYSSQIFWFALCFITLYYFASNIILPRIREILEERKSAVDSDISSKNNIESEIEKINSKTDTLRKEATSQYQAKLEEANQKAAKKRDKLNEDAKTKIENLIAKSQEDLQKFIDSTKSQNQSAIKDLVKNIRLKLFNIS